MNLFAYGTLMQRDILGRFVPGKPSIYNVTLIGFKKGGIRGLPYPAVIRNLNARVAGQLVMNVPNSSWKYLDEYEGPLYRRETVTVSSDRQRWLAQVYVLKSSHRRRWYELPAQNDNCLMQDIFAILQQRSEGISEYQLLEMLAQHPSFHLLAKDPQLVLYQKHFLVMNALYQLQQRFLLPEGENYCLEISPLNIQLKKITSRSAQETLPQQDGDRKLAEYYLDWKHF